MSTIIVPIDGSGSERALPAAEKLAAQFEARLVLVHVQQLIIGGPGGRFSAHVNEAGRLARVRELVARLRADGFDAELETHRTSLEHPATSSRMRPIAAFTDQPCCFRANVDGNVTTADEPEGTEGR